MAICSRNKVLESSVSECFSNYDYFFTMITSLLNQLPLQYEQSDEGEKAVRILFDIWADISLVP